MNPHFPSSPSASKDTEFSADLKRLRAALIEGASHCHKKCSTISLCSHKGQVAQRRLVLLVILDIIPLRDDVP